MHKKLTERLRGFSLIELLIAILIIGTIAAIALPILLSFQRGHTTTNSLSTVAGQTGTGTKTNPLQAVETWFNTKEGAVKCLTATTYAGRSGTYVTHTCDWQSLKKDQTVNGATNLTGAYVTAGKGLMFCATDAAYGSSTSVTYDCDWEHATQPTSRG